MREEELARAYGLREIPPGGPGKKVRSRSKWTPWPDDVVLPEWPKPCPAKRCLTMTPGGRLCYFDRKKVAA